MDLDDRKILESTSLIVLLVVFVATGLVILMLTVLLGDEPSEHITSGKKPFGPEDFPEVKWDEPLLASVEEGKAKGSESAFTVPPPPFSDEDIFPCSGCHADMEVNETPRAMEDYHEEKVLDHGPKDRWCLDCHNANDRDKLRLVNGKLIGFEESYKLCGQCHGTIFRDWREGIHGRRRGYWNGAKSYLLCANCHDPHAPRFKPMKPLPPPVRPEFLKQK